MSYPEPRYHGDHGDCECGFIYEDVPAPAAAGRLVAAVEELCAEIAGQGDALVRRHPAPEVWSPLEYCCHLRDVLVTQRERVVRTLVEDCPAVVPMHRDERAGLTRYAEEESARVLVQLRAVADMAAWTFDSLDADQWGRRCLYNYPAPVERDLAWVARHTVHEAVHHLTDVRRILTTAPPHA